MVTANLQVVWFKKDLRIVDHQPLAQAAGRGPVLPLFIIEPDLWAQPDMSDRHWCFLRTCLEELTLISHRDAAFAVDWRSALT